MRIIVIVTIVLIASGCGKVTATCTDVKTGKVVQCPRS